MRVHLDHESALATSEVTTKSVLGCMGGSWEWSALGSWKCTWIVGMYLQHQS